MTNWPYWINTQDHIGSQYPFYVKTNDDYKFSLDINDLLPDFYESKKELNVQAVIEMLTRSYILGDKTLIKSVYRTPWLAEFDQNTNDWIYFDVPPHGDKKLDPTVAAKELKSLLYEEIQKYIGGSKKVGLLLSGGMDSRILAGILRETQLNREFSGEVIVYNWGMSSSRDVWYAKRIADKYNWEYKHFPLNPDVLKENFYLAQKVGAETPPYNLHAMNDVAKDEDSEIILAGSYGDTLGRAEYNGTPLKQVPPVVSDNINKLGLIKNEVVKEFKPQIKEDSTSYRGTIDKHSREEYQYRETEYQRNHSRRYLSAAMSIIAMKKPLFQLFTSPKTVRFLWSLDLSVRSDTLYKHILPLLPGELEKVPWARTGKEFGSNSNESEDNGMASSHQYGKWLRNDLLSFINKELDFNLLCSLNIFNEKSLEKILKLWPKSTTGSVNKLDTTISWLTAFSMFIKKYNICNEKLYKSNFKDRANSLTLSPKIQGYHILRNKVRK